jgi:hypothetical protein
LYRWLEHDDGTLRDGIEKAESVAEHRHVAIVRKAAESGAWQAAAWWLERRHPDVYGRRERVAVSVDRNDVAAMARAAGVDAAELLREVDRLVGRGPKETGGGDPAR